MPEISPNLAGTAKADLSRRLAIICQKVVRARQIIGAAFAASCCDRLPTHVHSLLRDQRPGCDPCVEGETTNDLFAFLTMAPNAEVGAVQPKAMPVILRTPAEIDLWMSAPPEDALKLQRPLPDGALKIVAKGGKEDLPSTV